MVLGPDMEWPLSSSMLWCIRKDSILYYTKKFFISEASRLAVVPTQHPTVWVLARPLSTGVKQWMHEADHLRSAGFNILCSTSTLPCAFVLWNLIKHRDNFILAFEVCSLWNKRGRKALQVNYSLFNWTVCCSKDYSGVWLHVLW